MNNQEFATNEITVIGTVSDNVDQPQAIPVTVNGDSVSVESDGSFSYPLILTEGPNTITIVATDTSGNSNTVTRTVTYTPSVVADTTAPMLIVTSPVNNQEFATNEITVIGTVSDNVDQPQAIPVTVNGDSVSVESDGSFSYLLILTEGHNTITIVATDTAGNSNTVIRTVTYTPPVVADTTAPMLIVTSPVNNQEFATNEISVIGTVSDNVDLPQAIPVTVNGDSVSVATDGSFSYPLILTEGSNTITIVATDTSGNPNTVTRTVTYTPPVVADTTAPMLIVTSPMNNQVFEINEITVSGYATDDSGILSVTVNGDPVSVAADGSFSVVTFLTGGLNSITVIATDASDNHNPATVIRNVTYTPPVVEDTTAPMLVVSTPINGTVHTDYVTVSGFATDDSGIYIVTVNGVPTSLQLSGAFSFDLTLYSGSNHITISAIDNSPQHNSVTLMRNVIYLPVVADTTPPTLIVNQPVSDQTFYTNLITVSGIVSDMSGIQSVTVNGDMIPVAPSGSFSTQLILVEGPTTITVIAADNSPQHNIATVTRTVTYIPIVEDTTPPTLIVNQPTNGTVPINQITLSGTAYDPSGIYSVTVNGNAIAVNPDGSFSTSLILVNGLNVITVNAIDDSPQGNIATVTRTVTYTPPVVEDTTPPTLIVNQPANGTTVYTDHVTVSGSASDSSGIRSVTVNGVSVTLSNGTFGTTVWLNEGDNSIVVSAVDDSSNLNTKTVTRIVNYVILPDTTPPSITISFPTQGMNIISSDNTIHVTGSATDDTGIYSISVNGSVIAVDTSTMPVVFDTIVSLVPGSNTIVANATDNSTNHNTNSISVTINYTLPIVEPGPAYNITLSANPTKLIADGTDTATILAYVTDANGTAVIDGTVVSFTTTDGTLSDAWALTYNGRANVTLTSSLNPCTAVVTASSGSASTTLSIPFEASAPLSGWYWNVNMGIVHSPLTNVKNCSAEISGGVVTIYTTTETAAEIGAAPETTMIIYIDGSTLNITLQNPVVEGDHVTCTVSNILLNNAKLRSNFTITGIGIVESEIDVQFSNNCSLSGYTFLMTQHASIDDVNTSMKYIIANSTMDLTPLDLDENTAQVLQAFVKGAKAGDIVNVSIVLTVPLQWFNSVAGGDENNVWLFMVSDDGVVERLPLFIVSQTSDTVTFGAYTTHFSVFALVGKTPTVPTPTPTPARGGGGGAAAPPALPINVPIDQTTGMVTKTTTLPVEKATLTIPAGTFVKDAEGNPLSTSIITLYTPTTAESVGAIAAYEFGPSGTTFDPAIDLVISYDPADIPAGFTESDLVIRMWDGTAWIDLDTSVDTMAHTATAKVSHFTIFALFAAPPVAPPPVAPTPPVVTPTVPPVTPTPTPPPPFPVVPMVVVLVIVAAVIIVAVAYVMLRRRKA